VKKILFAALVGLGAFAGVKTVNAGAAIEDPLIIGSNYARGSMKSVRNGGTANDAIGCSIFYFGDDNGYLLCTARNSTKNVSCFENAGTKLNDFKRALAAMNSDSYIYFQWSADGRCSQIIISNNSGNRQ
jgi:hypothetical protein